MELKYNDFGKKLLIGDLKLFIPWMKSVHLNTNKKSVRLLYRFVMSRIDSADMLLCAKGEQVHPSGRCDLCVH